ncbi:enoyl-CoA hydratase [Aeromicrobium sp. 636]|uniref:Enoyl-CoA hydratase/isomerase family protein n=1 Tax=Aeromicrobium senzhongii TaxID=2663859 RepID=A0A8I0EVA5_9ACTN|nr:MULTISPECIES: enoyl-CoA hydratase-related protein [Aeromicrobium]MBC9226814.1 enoyl-CoA hydratase/isomerase family protein [Aeromicrobium senzhongii]MCQ3998914.1 enoyl-CoA hydratase [Aeromicrobium sp. 636]MTB89591.1 enoyl-CoA hydratase [Aeromicrobium senzhongii]QNL94282.1 enoyl-CoA hydratase/isomerase family protein [Aeromicrobium senzhongii]
MTDLLVDRTDGVLRLTLNCPERLNSVTTEMFDAMSDALADADGVRVAVITGEGRAFCSGAVMRPDATNTGILEAADRLIHLVTEAPFPVVAALNGLTAGIGSSLALAADFQVAKDTDYILQAFVNVGLMGDGAAHELIAASIGRARATRLLMLGEKFPNTEAFAAGLITHCVSPDEWQATVDGLVEKLRTGPTMAYARIKRTINAASLMNLDETLRTEAAEQAVLGASADFAEGVAAFTEKRRASFTGH